jgi:hypothetical protein
MRMLRPLLISGPLMLAILLSACGNKGDLVKPNPSTLPPPTTTPQPATPDATSPPAQPAQAAQPPQDSGGH